MKQIIIILLLFVCIEASAQTPRFIPYRKGNLWGYSSAEGKIVIPCTYYIAEVFSVRDVVLQNPETGKNYFKKIYSATVFTDAVNRKLIDSNNKKIDKKLDIIDGCITEEYPLDHYIYFKENKKGIKYKGRIIVEAGQYDDIVEYISGMLVVKINDKAGVVDTNGKVLIPLEYKEIHYIGHNLFSVVKDDKAGIYCIPKGIILPMKYLFNLSTDFYPSLLGSRETFIDSIKEFNDTANYWYLRSKSKNKYGRDIDNYVSYTGFEIIAQSLDSIYDSAFGVLNDKNKWIVLPKYKYIIKGEYGLYRVTLLNGKEGYVSNTGKEYFEE